MRETRTSGLMSGGVETGPLKDTAPPLDSTKLEKRCEARQSEICAGSVLAHVTKRIAAITPPRALVVLRFLLNTTEETDRIWPNPTTPYYLTNYIRSAETGEIFGLTCLSNEHLSEQPSRRSGLESETAWQLARNAGCNQKYSFPEEIQ